jgi:DNA-binding beta-propeller fold protein YncE
LAVPVDYQPHYLFTIYGVDQPVGVAVSPGGDRIYAAESGGEHLVKMFNRSGDMLGSFSPPDTDANQRAPIYLATDKAGNIYVSDLQQLAVEIFDPEGKYLDSIIGPELTLGEYVSLHNTDLGQGATFTYNKFRDYVTITNSNGEDTQLPAPGSYEWAPLGVRFDANGDLLLTDVIKDQHKVLVYPGDVLNSSLWQGGTLSGKFFGSYGSGNGNFLFPNVVVTDSKGRFFVTDGNNSRISVWDSQGAFLLNFGQGSGESALNLPRGAIIDDQDRLYVVDAVDHSIKVYDVSGDEVSFLFRLGDYGGEDGQFNYPNDIAIDQTGRLYIADRENNRIEVWSY